MLRVGLLGAGRIGQVHGAAIDRHPGSALSVVSDVHGPAAETLAQRYGAAVKSVEETIADPDLDAILVATSTDTHADLMEAATAAGKAVLCEKPVDLSLARARASLDAVSATGRPVMIGFNRRFDPNFAAVKAALDAGEVGHAELLSVTSFDPAPPPVSYVKVSGGLYRDMMIHDFDICRWLMGGSPETVYAAGSSLVDPQIGAVGDVDTAAVTLTWSDGRIAVIKNSRRAAYGYDQRIELLGSGGLLSAKNVLENTVEKATAQGVTGAKPEHFFLERYARAYDIEWDSFVRLVTEGAPNPVDLNDGVQALALAEAATLSRSEGQPVKVADL